MNTDVSPSRVRDFLRVSPRPLIVVLGPTASGKTSFSINLALSMRDSGYSPEIINADSRQCYRGFRIGTAVISPDEMQGIPHHLFGVLRPTDAITIAWYKEHAEACIDEVHARGGVPVLVGGSMLYISAVIDGLQPLPADRATRERLSREYDADAGETLHARLRSLDPEAASSVPQQNKRYVVRALEMLEQDGRTAASVSGCPYDVLLLGMDVPRDVLRSRIRERVRAMFDAGWAEEVRRLLAEGVTPEAPAMESHGYREIAAWLDAGEREEGLPSLRQEIAAKSARYAKRQMTWWRGDERITWVRPC